MLTSPAISSLRATTIEILESRIAPAALANFNLTDLTGPTGFKISGVTLNDYAGRSVSDAGDVNGDGFDDLLVGAPGANANALGDSGASYVFFGFDTGVASADTLTGTAGANMLIGGTGGDTLIGNGGADVLRGGEGNDVLAISDLAFLRLDGGRGHDTLRLDGAGFALDLTARADNRLTGLEEIDLSGADNHTLTLNPHEVLALSDHSNTLIVQADAGDTVTIGSGWVPGSDEVIGLTTFHVFTSGAATVKIESPAPFIAIGDATVLEGNTGTTSLSFTVTRGGAPLTATATVEFATANGTATAGEDYAAKMGTVTFNPGITAQTITIDVTGETRAEISETLFINLSNASGATLFDSQALGTITNDDSTLTVSTDRLTATFRDVDGDLVTVKAGKPVLDRGDFTLLPTGDAIGGEQLQKLNLRDIGAANAGVALTITAKPGLLGGDSFVNLGAIDATGVNLGAVSIAGDLGQIDAGAGTAVPPALASLTVGSLGRLGLSTQGAVGTSLSSDIAGALGKLVVKTDLIEAQVNVSGLIGSVAIGRSIVGGATSLAGSITASAAIGAVTLGGGLLGGAGADSASIHGASVKGVTLGGSMLGGAGTGSAVINGDTSVGAVTVKHDVRGDAAGSGAISSGGTLGAVVITGDLVGGAGNSSGSIFATGAITSVTLGGNLDATGGGRTGLFAGATLGPVKIGGNVLSALITSGGDGKGITVGGSVRSSQLLAGFTTSGTPLTSDAQLGALAVKGDWIASSAAAGINAGTGGFGTADDVVIAGTDPVKFSRIASIAIGGEARGTDGGSDSFAFTAEQIGSLKIGKTVFPLTVSATAEDELFAGPTFDLRARELDAVAPAAPAPLPVIGVSTLAFSLDFKTATFRDVDGDLVTVKNDKAKFDANNFTLSAGPNGGAIFQKLNLAGDPDFDGKNASITITAVRDPSGGDGWVDVGAIDATGIDLANVTVGGDLGVIDAGNSDSATPALTGLTVHSLGSRGLNTQATLGASAHSDIIGRVGALTVVTDVVGAAFAVNGGATDAKGSIGTAKVGGTIFGGGAGQVAEITATGDLTTATVTGDIRGGAVLHSGRIHAGGKIGTLLVSGSLVGGSDEDTGSIEGEAGIGKATIGRSLRGAGGEKSGSIVAKAGNITSVKVGGDLHGGDGDHSGSIFATGPGDLGAIGTVTVGGSVFATTGAKSGILSDATLGAVTIAGDVRALGAARVKISAEGIATPVDALKALAIKSLTIGGSVVLADLLAGYDTTGTLTNADVQTGPVTVKGDWTASHLLAGVSFAGAIFSGGEQTAIAARIASIVIGGSVLGTPAFGDGFAFSAQQIGSMKVGLALLPLTIATNDFPIGASGDVRVREVA